ncbi:hypothetical protein CASFOL_006682 [Castilleja foliolosa]|uniref:C3H1-type domain-containing protein n=1 Tax=Castilleja foliolosa TaxID=1961234 RepID=A0ABD3E812_9LAMI
MGIGFVEEKIVNFNENCSKLLELAAIDDSAAFIHEIEDKGRDVNEVSYWYSRSFGPTRKMGLEERTPIMIAALYGSTDVLKYIIGTHKVDVNRACGSDGATPLHCVAAGGSRSSAEAARLLIDTSADTDAVDAHGRKPGDLIAPSVRFSSKKTQLEMLLNGLGGPEENHHQDNDEGSKTPREKKEYPIDVCLPDINNGLYGTDEFRMYSFKVKPCSRAYSHDWTECPFVHPGENARRRDPRKYHYTCVPCPEFKKGSCAKGDVCEYAHGVFESWLHPGQYRTRLCKDETGCARKVCFFAHKPEELRPLYASTGSGMPSPKSVSVNNSLEMMSSLSPPMSPQVVACSSPMGGGGGNMWQNKANLLTPPTLQLPGSRLKTAFNARDVELDMSSPYGRVGDFNPTNLDEMLGSRSPSMSQLLRSSYPSNGGSPYGFDSSAAVAAAVMNSRSSAFAKRSQSFIDRSGGGYRFGGAGPVVSSPRMSEWGSPDGKLEWGFNGEEERKLRKSASFGYRGMGNDGGSTGVGSGEPDVSWVNSMVRDVPSRGGPTGVYGSETTMTAHWFDQMYIEKEQIVA